MVFAVEFSPDGTRLLSAGRDRAVTVWDFPYFDRLVRGNLDSLQRRFGE